MPNAKTVISGNTDMLLLKLLSREDMYGYQIIEELRRQSNNVFELNAGTLYPLLHGLEKKRYVESYDADAIAGKVRKYYRITEDGRSFLLVREAQWEEYSVAVNNILFGGVCLD